MISPLYINYPSWIHPQIFPNIPVLGLARWYGLMYVFAFVTAYQILKKLLKEGFFDKSIGTQQQNLESKTTEDDIFSFIVTGILFLLIGARIFATLVYDTSNEYRERPYLIFWPFDPLTGRFTGLAGMSYHGGFIGGLFGCILWCKTHKKPILQWLDAIVIAIPAGYTFGRLGNFLNGELFGRITTMPWGMVFPNAKEFATSLPWVQSIAEQIGMTFAEGQKLVNLPRHPSQLYEAFFEGIVIFCFLWNLRKVRKFNGFLTSIYPISYGLVRFFIEYFREPDIDLGYRLSIDPEAKTYLNTSLLNISTGQILCFLMIIGGIASLLTCYFLYKKSKVKVNN